MYSLLKTVSKLPSVAAIGQKAVGSRTYIVSGPPTRQISKTERGVIAAIFVGTSMIIPCWVLYHIPSYSKKG